MYYMRLDIIGKRHIYMDGVREKETETISKVSRKVDACADMESWREILGICIGKCGITVGESVKTVGGVWLRADADAIRLQVETKLE